MRNTSVPTVCWLLLLLLHFSFIAPLSALCDQNTPATESALERLSKGVQKIQLSNGLRILFYHRPSASVFAGEIWVKVGGVNEAPGSTGIAHFLEHMAFKGTDKIGTKNFAAERELLPQYERLASLKQQGAKIDEGELERLHQQLENLWVENEYSQLYLERGGETLNASTSKDYTDYTVELPDVAFEFWCWMESERLLHPVFRQFSKEREVVLEERRMRTDDNPDGLVYEALLNTAFVAHPNRLPVIGWPSDIRRMTAEDVMNFRNQYYRPDNMVISLVGDLDLEKVRPQLEHYFGRIPRPDTALPEVRAIEPAQLGERTSEVRFDAEPAFVMAYHKPTYPDPDDVHFAVLHALLAGGRSSILYDELVRKRQLATSVATGEAPGERFPNLFLVDAAPRNGVTNAELRDAIQELLDRYKTKKFTESEMAAAKRRVRVGFLEDLPSDHGLAAALGRSELLFNDWQAVFKVYDDVMNTTAEDLQQLAKRYLTVENRTYVHLEKHTRSEIKNGAEKSIARR